MPDSMHIEHLPRLHLLWLVALLAAGCVWALRRRRAALETFASAGLLSTLMPNVSFRRPWVRAGLVVVALATAVFGMIDPRWGVYYEDVRRRGIDIVFCLDVSNSMLAEDVSPNRLERAKQYIRDTVDVLGGDRVGLVTFAGTASVKCPLTINYGAFRMSLDEVDTKSSPRGGTLIGDAIRTAAASFVDQVKGFKAIIVITDGEDQDSYPRDAAKKAYDDIGARIYTIGLGDTSQGQRIPITQNGQRVYLQHDGQEVWSKMNPDSLRQVAEVGKGAYIPVGTRQFDMGQYYTQRIATADQRDFEASRVAKYRVQFQWFAAAAALLLIIEAIMSDVRASGDRQGMA